MGRVYPKSDDTTEESDNTRSIVIAKSHDVDVKMYFVNMSRSLRDVREDAEEHRRRERQADSLDQSVRQPVSIPRSQQTERQARQ